jgi:cytochrome c-type biogenesis protein CcmH/NrfF
VKAIALALLLALSLAPTAIAAQPQTSLTDIEDEVMCPICGTLLGLSDSPQAQREKVFISELIAEGKTKAQIEDALVTQYGQEVLALPRGSGFDLSAYLVPIVGFVIAAAALAFGVSRWRRDARASKPAPVVEGPQGEEAERLDADLARYDL